MAGDCHLKFRGWTHVLSRPAAQVGRRVGRGRPWKRCSGHAAGALTAHYATSSRKHAAFAIRREPQQVESRIPCAALPRNRLFTVRCNACARSERRIHASAKVIQITLISAGTKGSKRMSVDRSICHRNAVASIIGPPRNQKPGAPHLAAGTIRGWSTPTIRCCCSR